MGIKVKTYVGRDTDFHERACFGFLASGQWNRLTHISWMPERGSNVGCWSSFNIAGVSANESDWKRYVKAIREIVDNVPMYREFQVIPENPSRFSEVEVKVPTTLPADQIILGFFMLRNLSHYQTYGQTYSWLRTNTELPLAASLMLAQMFTRKSEVTAFEGENNRWTRNAGQTEPSPIHQATFGKFSFNAFARQTEEFSPWQQPLFNVQGHYKRDSYYSSSNIRVRTNLTQNMNEIGDSRELIRYMGTCLTVTEVEAPFHSGISTGYTGSDADFLAKMAQVLDEDFGVSETLREAIRFANLTPEQRAEELRQNPLDPQGHFRPDVAVRMSAEGRNAYTDTQFNPHNQVGYVINVASGEEYLYQVRWNDSNFVNDYRANDLVLAD